MKIKIKNRAGQKVIGCVLCRLFKKAFQEVLNFKTKLVLGEEMVYESQGKAHKYAERMVCKAPEIGISLASPKKSKQTSVVKIY